MFYNDNIKITLKNTVKPVLLVTVAKGQQPGRKLTYCNFTGMVLEVNL